MITELFFSHVLSINRDSLHTRSYKDIHLSVFSYRLSKNNSAGLKHFWDSQEKGTLVCFVHLH